MGILWNGEPEPDGAIARLRGKCDRSALRAVYLHATRGWSVVSDEADGLIVFGLLLSIGAFGYGCMYAAALACAAWSS